MRGIRGAITVEENSKNSILTATEKLLSRMVESNGIQTEDIASIIFTVTPDLDQAFPAEAARNIGWKYVPLFCAQELDIEGGLSRCLRILIHVNTNLDQEDIAHIYLKGAKKLRPDLTR